MKALLSNKIQKMTASVVFVGLGITTLFAAAAAATPGPVPSSSSFDPVFSSSYTELEIEVAEIEIESGIIDIFFDEDPEVELDPSDCGMFNVLDITVTNEEDNGEFYRVDGFNGTIEPSEDPVFEYGDTPDYTESTGVIGPLPFDTDSSEKVFLFTGDMLLVQVYEINAPWSPASEKLVFEEEVVMCDLDVNLQIANAIAEHQTAAAAEAQAAAEAAEQALAEAAAEAEAAAQAAAEAHATIAQANAEKEQAEAAQAEAEKELALVQAEAEEARANAVLAQAQTNEETVENTSEDSSSETPETSDEELAVGDGLGEHSKSGMSGVVLGLIIVLGLVGVGAVTGAVLNLRKQP
ncbi:MAG: hypothetical protein P8J01_03525 [Acidimicrobiales bacterium]|nr:hypothetical protein [Acidimicrobiales bacterium]